MSATEIRHGPLILSVTGLTRLTTLIEGTHFEFIDEEAEENDRKIIGRDCTTRRL